ncbi:MAG: hypothetical protein GC186_20170 [Rhodobacteraceae bacterium]|nr:hypothetical protein [Paracoccaceae bacterium]
MAATERLAAGAVALVALAALTAQAVVISEGVGAETPWMVVWKMAGSFSLLANAAVVAVLGLVGFAGLIASARQAGAVTVGILAVGIINNAFPASLGSLVGLDYWADFGLHVAVPLLVLAWWLAYARRDSLRALDAFLWLGWPVAYVVYVLVREMLTGQAPYAFLDVSRFGWPGVSVHIVGFALLILVLGAALLLIAKAFGPRTRHQRRVSR